MQSNTDAMSTWLDRYPELARLFDPNATEEEFNEAIESRIEAAVRWLEENAKRLSDAKEEGLSTTLAGRIEMPGIEVSVEENSNGHVDITIKVSFSLAVRKRLGEAKIYNGYAYHVKGLEQLLGYCTGREHTGYVFVYFQVPASDTKFEQIKTSMNHHLPCQQTRESTSHKAYRTFCTEHKHSCDALIRVVHFGINLHV